MKRTILDFTSNRLAFILMATLLVLIALSAVIPQRGIAQDQMLDWKEMLGGSYTLIETIGLDRIYFSPLFFVVLGLLGVNLAVANIRRFRLVYRVHGTLLRARHLGSIVFHLSLLVIMTSVILNYAYKFNGMFALTEGQTGRDAPEGYSRQFAGPLSEKASGRFRVTMKDVDTDFRVGESTTTAATLLIQPQGHRDAIEGTIRINQPLRYEDFEFHLGAKTGYSPEILLIDSEGEVRFRSFVRLAAQKTDGRETHADYVPLGIAPLNMRVEVEAGEPGFMPRVWVQQEGSEPAEVTLAPGDTLGYAGWRIAIPRMRQWAFVEVVRSPFLDLVFFGFWAALAGMLIGFVPRIVGRRRHA
jgi:hypothetical protein